MKKLMVEVALVLGMIGLSACTQMPTEKQSIADVRPQIAFNISHESLRDARVILDGMDAGTVADYSADAATLRILPGTHVLRVVLGSKTLLDERFYLGDGANRTFLVK